MSDTNPTRPTPRRPDTGFQAWQATIGYISNEYSPDAMLTLDAKPQADRVVWGAVCSWAHIQERVTDKASLSEALNLLWQEVDRHHRIFKTFEALVRRPADYAVDKWIDAESVTMLEKLLEMVISTFKDAWQVIIVYQPVSLPDSRLQVRLLADQTQVSGRGATLYEASRDLYTNAAPDFFGKSN